MSKLNGPFDKKIVIIGAGIVGLSVAYYLQRQGLQCTVIDSKGAGGETSYGNAGSVSIGSIFPHALPGVFAKGLKMLFDPLAPLKINWMKPRTVLPWLWRFIFSAQQKRVLRAITAINALNRGSIDSWQELTQTLAIEHLVKPNGFLHVYSDRHNFILGEWEREIMRQSGVRFSILDRDALLALEPGLGETFQCGMLELDSLAVRDPGNVCQILAAHLRAQGVEFIEASVTQIDAETQTVVTDAGHFSVENLVIAAGVWSKRLLQQCGQSISLIPARGYHVMFDTQNEVVQRPTLWAERYMVISPMQAGIRMTSVKELTSVDSDPQPHFIRRLIPEAKKLFPLLRTEVAAEWMGNRPCTPDSLPVLDKLPGRRIFVATGHGHMGLTQGPYSGKLIAQWMVTGRCEIDMSPYSIVRFQ